MNRADDRNVDLPEDGRRHRKLMISVLATQIQDYLYAKETAENIAAAHMQAVLKGTSRKQRTAKELRRTTMLTRGLKAMSYIFEDTWESENYVFGFKFICRYIELEPEKFRKAIWALKREHVRGIWDRARGREIIEDIEERDD